MKTITEDQHNIILDFFLNQNRIFKFFNNLIIANVPRDYYIVKDVLTYGYTTSPIIKFRPMTQEEFIQHKLVPYEIHTVSKSDKLIMPPVVYDDGQDDRINLYLKELSNQDSYSIEYIRMWTSDINNFQTWPYSDFSYEE